MSRRVSAYGRAKGAPLWNSLGAVIRFELAQDRYEAYSTLELELAGSLPEQTYQEIMLKLDGKLLFQGIVDVQSFQNTGKGKRMQLSCRSMSALMADNQPKPDTYFRLTPQTAAKQFAQPYGLSSVQFSSDKEQNYLVVEIGMSCWDAMNLFCRQCYHRPLYADRTGCLKDTAASVEEAWISNQRQGGLRYSSLSLIQNRKEMLSRVYLKTDYVEEQSEYTITLDNSNALAKNILRQRYLQPSERWYRDIRQYGQDMLDRSNIHSNTLEAVLPGLQDVSIGSIAKFPEAQTLLDSGEYRIYRIQMHYGADGSYTKISVCKPFQF